MLDQTPTAVAERNVSFLASDGFELHGRWFEAANPTAVVIIAPGAGIPGRFYHRLAAYVAACGAAVLTFDYRGIGMSRKGSLRRLTTGMEHWAQVDLSAAFSEALRAYPTLPLSAIAHSIGTLFLGAASGASNLKRIVFFGPHTGYWRDYRARWRLPMFGVWHVFMPAVTRVVGYFPGGFLRLGEDLPPQAARDWAQRRQPQLPRNHEEARRLAPILARYRDVRAEALAFSITDDAFAPPAAAQRVLSLYPNLRAHHESIAPSRVGCRRLGHFGFLRRPHCEFFWQRASQFLLPESRAV